MTEIMVRYCIVCQNIFGCVEINLGVIEKKECWRCANNSECINKRVVNYTHGVCGKCEKERLEV